MALVVEVLVLVVMAVVVNLVVARAEMGLVGGSGYLADTIRRHPARGKRRGDYFKGRSGAVRPLHRVVIAHKHPGKELDLHDGDSGTMQCIRWYVIIR